MIGEIYKLTDSKPQAYAEILNVTKNDVWDQYEETYEETEMAWGDWYMWREDVRVMYGAWFEVSRLVKATEEEIAVYKEKVAEHSRELEEEK